MRTLWVLTALFVLGLSAQTLACGGGIGWVEPSADIGEVTIEGAIADLHSKFDVRVTKSQSQSRCVTEDNYDVVDAGSKAFLAHVPVSRTNSGASLLVRVYQLMETPRAQLIDLRAARDRFYDDARGLEADLGISAYVPNALPIEQRTTQDGMGYTVYVTTKVSCRLNFNEDTGDAFVGQSMPSLIERKANIKTLEYLPGRVQYSADTIYQSGDLRKALLGDDEVYKLLLNRFAQNIKYCPADSEYSDGKAFWQNAIGLLADRADALKSGYQRFSEFKGKPVGAFMINARKITVIYKGSYKDVEVTYGGNLAEILKIQKALGKVKIDKRKHLDTTGTYELRWAEEDKSPLPQTLQE